MLMPNGSDWVEYMTTPNPNPKQLGGMHHVALEVMDIQKPYETGVDAGVHAAGAAAWWRATAAGWRISTIRTGRARNS